MIQLSEYFLDHNHAEEHKKNAEELLRRVNALLSAFVADGGVLNKNPYTKSYISGEKYGGFRPQDCPIGAPKSAHKLGMAVDVYDKGNQLDSWLTDLVLLKFDLYREAPEKTINWAHLSTKAPGSGKRTFYP